METSPLSHGYACMHVENGKLKSLAEKIKENLREA